MICNVLKIDAYIKYHVLLSLYSAVTGMQCVVMDSISKIINWISSTTE